MRNILLSVVAFSCCLFLHGRALASVREDVPSPDEREVYLAIINRNFPDVRPVFLIDKTIDLKDAEQMREQFKSLNQHRDNIPPTLVADFEDLNGSAYQMNRPSPLAEGVVLIAEGGVRGYLQALKEGGKEVPRAVVTISFSRAAFSRGRDQALVYASWFCGSECGFSGFMLMRKEKGVWKGRAVGVIIMS